MKFLNNLLSFFGYIKIPKETIELSIVQEIFFEELIKIYKDKEISTVPFEYYLKNQKVLTKFLRSGRLLNN